MAREVELVSPPPPIGGCPLNPATILMGMIIASTFTWFFGSRKNKRKVTRLPRYALGDTIDGREVTAVRTT